MRQRSGRTETLTPRSINEEIKIYTLTTDLSISAHRQGLGIPHQEPQHHNQRLEHYYHKRLECDHHQEEHLPFRSGSHLLLRPGLHLLQLGSHRMHRITRSPVRDSIQASERPSTARATREHRGQTSRPRVWISPTSRKTNVGSRKKET